MGRRINKTVVLYIAALLSLIVLITIGTFITMLLNNNNENQIVPIRPVIVASNHLEPDVNAYALCWMKSVTPEMRSEIAPNDIVIYSEYIDSTEVTICQKVIKKNGMILTTGANTKTGASQDTIKSTNVRAKITSAWNWTSPLIKALTIPMAFWSLIALCCALCVLAIVVFVFNKRRHR